MATFLRMALQTTMMRTTNALRFYTSTTMLTGSMIGGIMATGENSTITYNDEEVTGVKKIAIMSIGGAISGPVLVPAVMLGYITHKVN